MVQCQEKRIIPQLSVKIFQCSKRSEVLEKLGKTFAQLVRGCKYFHCVGHR